MTTSSENGEQILMEGWLLKKPTQPQLRTSKYWNDRYFVLQGKTLSYHMNQSDLVEKGSFYLTSRCEISEIFLIDCKGKRSHNDHHASKNSDNLDDQSDTAVPSKYSKKQKDFKYCIKITWPEDEDLKSSNSKSKNDVAIKQPTKAKLLNQNGKSLSMKHIRNSPKIHPKQRQSFENAEASPKPPNKQHHIHNNTDEIPHIPKIDNHTDINRKYYSEQAQQQILAKNMGEDQMQAMARAAKRASNRKAKKKMMRGGSIVAATTGAVVTAFLTAGSSVLMGILFLGIGAAAGGSGAVVSKQYKKQKNVHTLLLAASTNQEAEMWKAALEDSIRCGAIENSLWASIFAGEGRSPAEFLLPTSKLHRDASDVNDTASRAEKKQIFRQANARTRWEPMEGGWATGALGLRIFREEKSHPNLFTQGHSSNMQSTSQTQLSVKGRPCPPLKAQVILNSSPLNAFMCLMSHPRLRSYEEYTDNLISPASGQRASFRVVEQKNSNSDIIHLVFRPLYLFPTWTAPRDFCINRYWRLEDDGSYIICYDSVVHPDCPPCPPYVRGELNGIYSIAPTKQANQGNTRTECLLTHIVQVDPRGWIPTTNIPYFGNQGNAEAFAVSSLLQMMDIRDALDHERFVTASLDDPPMQNDNSLLEQSIHDNESMQLDFGRSDSLEEDMIHYDFAYSGEVNAVENELNFKEEQTIATCPEPLLSRMWAEPDANSFKVRGKFYKNDKKKFNAGKSMFRLFAVDFLRVSSFMMDGIAEHPKERIQQALLREEELTKNGSSAKSDVPPFIFMLNITLPGPQLHHMLFYFAVDNMSTIDGTDGTPFSKLANQFFFWGSDEFRDQTFKLIPQIVEGNFIVRRAVGSTPAIMGTKLKQYYFRGDRYFELMLDVGSSSVAAGVTGLAAGYAKSLVVDMAFLLEGNDESTLPEKVMGCCRLKHVDLANGPRVCEPFKSKTS